MRIILFDIDGTLLSTGGAGLAALQEVFLETFALTDAVRGVDFFGRTDPHILDQIAARWLKRRLTPEEFDTVTRGYAQRLPARLQDTAEFRVLPGAAEVVADLHRQGCVLGLATGNLEPTAYAKLRRAQLDGFFEFGGFGSDSSDRAELTRIAVERGRLRAAPDTPAIVVGDTIHDVESALAAGAECLAVATGNADEVTLRAAGATWTAPGLDHPAAWEILGVVGAR